MIDVPAQRCGRHRRRDAAGRCSTCGAGRCGDCLVPTPVGFKCLDCLGTLSGHSSSRRRRWPPVTAGAGLLLVLVVLTLWRAADGGGNEGAPGQAARQPADKAGLHSRDLRFAGTGGVRIGGTLALPTARRGRLPAVLVLAGFGPTDRDGLARPNQAPDRLYLDVSRALGERGVASFRYDKRGTGESVLSTGQRLSFDDLVADAQAGLSFLAERSEVDPERLAVVGHDEGGLVALRLAASDPRVKSVVLLSTPGRPLVEVISDDFRANHGAASADAFRATVDALLRTGVLPPSDQLPPEHRGFFPTNENAYLTSIFSLDPAAEAAGVDVPVLVVRGERSTGISAADSGRLAEALGGRAEVMVGADAGYMLELAAPAPPASASGEDDHTQQFHSGTGAAAAPRRDDALVGKLASWLAARLGAS